FSGSLRRPGTPLFPYTTLFRSLADGGLFEGRQIVSQEHLRLMTSDQVPAIAKTPDSFFPGFWDRTGWGFGVGVDTEGRRAGRYGDRKSTRLNSSHVSISYAVFS